MVKRLLSANASEIVEMTATELKQSIKASDGRVVLSENVVTRTPVIPDKTNAELARAFGADLILLNGLDAFDPKVVNVDEDKQVINELRRLVCRPIGVNLEPVDETATMSEEKLNIVEGPTSKFENVKGIRKIRY